jgi:4-diphosphocytidyl-2-C-methyl-D-erythritol kinase
VTSSAALVQAEAKVNLLLRILARERSGYHQLETLFCRLTLADTITVRAGGRGRSLDCRGPAVPDLGLGPAEHNLAYRAAAAFAAAAGWPDGFAIEIEKCIPVGGGLGGGSADAAAVLRALNAMAPRKLSMATLLSLAASLGADVPFLASDAVLALGWGRGERLLALPPLPSRDVVLLVPPTAIATADAYGWIAAARSADGPVASAMDVGEFTSWARIAWLSANDFEAVVFPRFGALEQCLRAMQAVPGVLVARLAGSGSTLFALLDERAGPRTRTALEELAARQLPGWRAVSATTATVVAPVRLLD